MAKFIPKKLEKVVISIRIARDTLAEIDDKATEIGISRNDFINQCLLFSLANMESDGEKRNRLRG